MINQRIGSFIAAVRKEQNLTQEQLAEKLGISSRSVSRWENGRTLPDLSLMYSLCHVLGISMPELLSGARQKEAVQRKDILLLVLALSDREKQAKKKKLNQWFAFGLAALLAAFPAASALTPVHAGILVGLGIALQAAGFYHNNLDHTLTARERAVLIAADGELKMRFADEMVQFAKKMQNADAVQYKTAFAQIAENLAAREHVIFSMVADEFSTDGNPGPWHAGIAVTEERVFLCGETMAGQFMTRNVLIVCKREEILSVRYANRGIILKTPREEVTIRGENMAQLSEKLKNAIASGW